MVSELRLDPFPDAVVEARDLDRAIRFLAGLGLPFRYAARHLRRWSDYTGVPVTSNDQRRAAGLAIRLEE